jgi:hypothetical protein
MNQSDNVKEGDSQTLRKKWYMALTRYSLLWRNVRTSSKSPRAYTYEPCDDGDLTPDYENVLTD